MVDSVDRARLEQSRDDLKRDSNDLAPDIKIIVLANKQDHEQAMGVQEVIEGMQHEKLTHKWYVIPKSAVDGCGLDDWVGLMKSNTDS